MKIIFLTITLITFIIFFMEALIHFNIGKNALKETSNYECVNNKYENHNYILFYNIRLHIPTYQEFIEISFTVLLFSILSSIISTMIIKYHITK